MKNRLLSLVFVITIATLIGCTTTSYVPSYNTRPGYNMYPYYYYKPYYRPYYYYRYYSPKPIIVPTPSTRESNRPKNKRR